MAMTGGNAARANPASEVVYDFRFGERMAQECKPGQIVPQSGVYAVTHDPLNADMPYGNRH